MSTFADLPPDVVPLHEGAEFEVTAEGYAAKVDFLVYLGDLDAFLEVVGGLTQTVTIGGVTTTRKIPLEHWRFPNCFAYRVGGRGDGPSSEPTGGGIDHEWYKISVWFNTPAWNLGGDYPVVTRRRESGLEMVTRPGSAYKFPSDNLILPQQVGVPVTVSDIILVFHQISTFDESLYDTLAGCVNETTFYNKPAGTMQYVGPSTSGSRTLGGVETWEVAHHFRYRSIPHNMIMRPDGALVLGIPFEAPVEVTGGDYLLPEAELNDLFV
jgi:hypothetical protein